MRDVDRRRRYEDLKSDRQLVDQAAAQLRYEARMEQYRGKVPRPEIAFSVAGLLDELSRQLNAVPDGVRGETVVASRMLLGLEYQPRTY